MKPGKIITTIVIIAAVWCIQLPVYCQTALAGMQNDVDQAVASIQKLQEIPEQSIPPYVLRNAKGIAILTVIKAGFIFSGRGGTGIVLARTSSGWSGPSAIGNGGIGVGFQAGAQMTEFVIVLNTPNAVQAFSQYGNFSLGADLSVAAGPVGRNAAVDVLPLAAVYTYSCSQGLFAGVSLEGTVIAARNDANAAYYGRAVTPADILSGKANPPAGASKLINLLSKY
jgi:lipid-binding SYLF domain-containing protein